MKKLYICALIVCAACISSLAQTGDDYRKNEFYVGAVVSVVNNTLSEDKVVGGVQTSYTRNVHRFFGFKGEVSAVQKNVRSRSFTDFDFEDEFGVPVRNRLRINTFMGGIEVKDNTSKKKIVPFAHALFGVGHVKIKPKCGNQNCIEPPGSPNVFRETGFAAGIGGGIDIKVSKLITLRAIQADYNPIQVNGETDHNFRIGIGIVLK